jgi:hypothetical protein
MFADPATGVDDRSQKEAITEMTRTELLRQRQLMRNRIRAVVTERRIAFALASAEENQQAQAPTTAA